MTKAERFERIKKRVHRDFVGKSGILVCRNGRTVIVDESTITTEELERLENVHGRKTEARR
jgi:hypothetical protein